MEFGLFLQGYVPGPAAHDTDRPPEYSAPILHPKSNAELPLT